MRIKDANDKKAKVFNTLETKINQQERDIANKYQQQRQAHNDEIAARHLQKNQEKEKMNEYLKEQKAK